MLNELENLLTTSFFSLFKFETDTPVVTESDIGIAYLLKFKNSYKMVKNVINNLLLLI